MLHRGLLGVVLFTFSACAIDRAQHYDRPARFETAINTRHIGAATADRPATSSVARSTTETPTVTVPDTGGQGVSVAARFTMRTAWLTYLGVEAEAGALAREGSNLAGGYGVAGTRQPLGHGGALSAEVVAGWRSIRDSLEAPDRWTPVIEPRLRGEMWLGEQVTLGGTLGADLSLNGAWVAGVYLGVHSRAYGGDRDRD